MNYWLIKSEPFKYSWDQFKTDKKTCWDGVRNYQARNNLKAMKKGDLLLFYHSNEGMCIVGIAKVVKEHYQDPTTKEEAWVSVDVAPFKALNTGYISSSKSRRLFKRYAVSEITALISWNGEARRV